MDASGLEALAAHFEHKLSQLTGSLAIERSIHHEEADVRTETQQSLESVWRELDELSVILTLMRAHLAEHRQNLGGVQEVKRQVTGLLDGLQHAHDNLPPHLPPVHTPVEPTRPVTKEASKVKPPLPALKVSETPSSQRTAVKPTHQSQSHSSPCPLIEYLTVHEFGDVPKYMKGRMVYQQVNAFIDEANKTFMAKYKLLPQKKSTLSDANRKRYETFKMQETKDTAGAYFVTEDDLKEWSTIKMGKENRSVLTMLRHCGRIFEIRSGGLVRYALADTYR